MKASRQTYADMFGPTVGDRMHLVDIDLWLEVERDFTVHGEEVKFDGDKVIRDDMGQSQLGVAQVVDAVITNTLILDYWGAVKADVGLKDGHVQAIGKAGNPDIQPGANIVISAGTEVIAGEGMILTVSGIDTHTHFICSQQIEEALMSGVITMIGGGTSPIAGINAITRTSGPWHTARMLQAADTFPMNIGFTDKGSASLLLSLEEQALVGAVGLKLHEGWNSTPAATDNCLEVAERHNIRAVIHTDTFNESGFVETTFGAFKGRTIHTYHIEGVGGGRAPDVIKVCGSANVLPSSTSPTRLFIRNTIDERLDMLMVCHHFDPAIAGDVASAESHIRRETIAAEDILHDFGVFSMISSDSQAMGRVGEVIMCTQQAADKMKCQRGRLDGDGARNDNFRARRYIAKYTINPVITHGISHEVGSVEAGKWADLVLQRLTFFGVKLSLILKGGAVTASLMGDINSSVPMPQPVHYRPMFASYTSSRHATSLIFVNQAAFAAGVLQQLSLCKAIGVVSGYRSVQKSDPIHNGYLPTTEVDAQNYQVCVDGQLLRCEPTDVLPMTQRYFLL